MKESGEGGDEKTSGAMLSGSCKVNAIIAEQVTDKLYRVAQLITLLESQDSDAPITVYVNSPGGSADSGFAIYDLFQFSRCPIVTIANGVVASSAVLIYLGGDKDRFSLPNARFLLHQPSDTRGSCDIEITAQQIVKIRERYNKIVEEKTGRDADTVTADADRDFRLSAGTHEYGLVQKVITRRADIEE